jgi:phenylacetate-CoA ligase
VRIQDARYEHSDPTSIRSLQFQKVQHLLRHAWATNDFYRPRLEAAGVDLEKIRSLDEFAARVPTVSKADFVADQAQDPPFGRRHASARQRRLPIYWSTTSGTSGQGVEVHGQTADEMAITCAVYAYGFRWAGLEMGDQLFLAMPITMLSGGRCEYHGAIAYGLSVSAIGNYDASRKMELMQRFQPDAVIANTSYLGRLGMLLAGTTRPQLRCLISGGEGSGLAWLRRLVETWAAPVFDRYGSTQTGNDHMFVCDAGIGTESRPGMLHNIDPFVLVEVVDPASGKHVTDGEAGELIITSLYHLDTPLIRCRIGDRAVFHEAAYCNCGRPFTGVEVASISRVDDLKKIKGVNVWPQAVDDVLFATPEVEEYQVVLGSAKDGADTAILRAMLKESAPNLAAASVRDRLADQLHRRIGIHFTVEILPHGKLEIDQWKARRWRDTRSYVAVNAAPMIAGQEDAG